MTPRSIRRAQERKARKEMERKARKEAERKAKNLATRAGAEELVTTATETDDLDVDPPVISEAKLRANRANAQLSTGPKSAETKAKTSLNAVKTGLTGRTVLLPTDDAAEYERHIQAFAAEYAPVGLRESDLVQSIADTWWRLKRIPCLESALLAQGYLEFAESFDEYDPSVRPSLVQAQAFLKYEKQLRNLQLQEARLFRRYEKDRAELRQLQQARHSREAEALENAAALYEAAKQKNQPFNPADCGFDFSIAEIEQHFARTQVRDQRLSQAKRKSPSRLTARAESRKSSSLRRRLARTINNLSGCLLIGTASTYGLKLFTIYSNPLGKQSRIS